MFNLTRLHEPKVAPNRVSYVTLGGTLVRASCFGCNEKSIALFVSDCCVYYICVCQ